LKKLLLKKSLTVIFGFLFFHSGLVDSGLFASEVFASDNSQKDERTLSFAEAGEMAAAASFELRAEIERQNLRENAWKMGFRDYFPSITLTAAESDRVIETGPGSFEKMYSLSLSQILFDGGKLFTSRRLQKAEITLQKNSLQNMFAEISEGAISVYRGILQARMNLEIKRASLLRLEKQEAILKTELRLGLATVNDSLESELLLSKTKIEIEMMEMDLAESEKSFAEMLGLETLPQLVEKIDIRREIKLPETGKVSSEILARNPEMETARLSLKQREEEAKAAARSWVPTIKGTGSFSLTGTDYPLSHYKWSCGLVVDLSTALFGSSTTGNYGREGRADKTAQLAESLTVLPSLQSGLNARSAKLNFELERTKYESSYSKLERNAELMMKKLEFMIRKKELSITASELMKKKIAIAEVKLELGLITRLELMESELEYAESEIAVVEAVILETTAIREIEKYANLPPGGFFEL
jgi:outer membrane protein TolC